MVLVGSGDSQVPAALPQVLKEYTKAAIRTQPRDLLVWSLSYFRCLVDGTIPPVKDRLEFPVPVSSEGISPGILRVLHRQLSGRAEDGTVDWPSLAESCHALGVRRRAVDDAWNLTEPAEGSDGDRKPWDHLLSHLAIRDTATVVEALQSVMFAVTDDPVTKKVPLQLVLDHYARIHAHTHAQDAELDQTRVVSVHQDGQDYLTDVAEHQDGHLVPSDLTRPSCPPLQ
ncbi:cAMP-dependent protein kinase regulatory subunit dimerization-anchoring domain [Trinorchestia longiramus]|nr:cAMP-dependent protein kinase regulatory subunit dimerization-anchoring domain [Trinorchestia longiramus]